MSSIALPCVQFVPVGIESAVLRWIAMVGFWVFLTLFIGAGIAMAVVAAAAYSKFNQRPEKKWKDRVIAELGRVRMMRASFVFNLDNSDQRWQQESETLVEKYFARTLSGISVSELENFPGIGPATVARLAESGYSNLLALHRANISIPGIGIKRLTDINHAVQTLIRQAQSRFNDGGCFEARELAPIIDKRQKEIAAEKIQLRLQREVAENVLLDLKHLAKEARGVTFWQFIMASEDELVSHDLMEKAIPTFDSYIAVALSKGTTESSRIASRAQLERTDTPSGRFLSAPSSTVADGTLPGRTNTAPKPNPGRVNAAAMQGPLTPREPSVAPPPNRIPANPSASMTPNVGGGAPERAEAAPKPVPGAANAPQGSRTPKEPSKAATLPEWTDTPNGRFLCVPPSKAGGGTLPERTSAAPKLHAGPVNAAQGPDTSREPSVAPPLHADHGENPTVLPSSRR